MKIRMSCEIKKFSFLRPRLPRVVASRSRQNEICGFADNLKKSKSIIQFIFDGVFFFRNSERTA